MDSPENKFCRYALLLISAFITMPTEAQEMNQQPQGRDMAPHDMSLHGGHDMGAAAAHLHHGHGEGGWMISYSFMSMSMDGLLDGNKDVDSDVISGTTMDTASNRTVTAGRDYMMAPTAMSMNMHMLMGMYGITEQLSMMVMINYLSNDMDMIMHMTMDGGVQTQMKGAMSTSGLGDGLLGLMYAVRPGITASLGLSIPTGSINENVDMNMNGTNPADGMSINVNILDQQAPYAMQLGSGSVDLIPAVTYKDRYGHIAWEVQGEYVYRSGENGNEYTLGNQFKLDLLGKLTVFPFLVGTGRLRYLNWDSMDGRDPDINPMMSPAGDPDASGGTRTDFMIGMIGRFSEGHAMSFEVGIPVQQDLNGPQMKTDMVFGLKYQFTGR